MYNELKETPKDKIIYTSEELEDGNLKISFFVFEGIYLIRRFDFYFKPDAKNFSQLHFFEIQQNVVIREDFITSDNYFVNKYDLNGNILAKTYDNGTVLEVFEYDDNGVLIKMNYFVKSKFKKIFEYTYNKQTETYDVIEKDIYGKIISSYKDVPKLNFIRPERLAFEISK